MLTRAVALTLPFLLTGCANSVDISPATSAGAGASAWTIYQSASPSPAFTGTASPYLTTTGTFQAYRPRSTAITYNPAVVPLGATVTLSIARLGYATEVRLTAGGLLPNRMYGAHLHTQPCTANPDDAGPHYQNRKDPVTPSVDPAYVNPSNEVWPDFTTSSSGGASAVSAHDWAFDPAAPPRSLVLHETHTTTTAGSAGKAGARAACLTLPPVQRQDGGWGRAGPEAPNGRDGTP